MNQSATRSFSPSLLLRLVCLLLLLVTPLSISAAEPTAKTRVLLVTGGHGFDREPFFKMFRDMPGIALTTDEHKKGTASVFDRTDLASFDVVVLYDMVKTISDSQKANFLSLTEKGVGLVVLHHALVSYQDWPEYERIIGGLYPEGKGQEGKVTEKGGYEHDVDIPVKVVGRHPITAGLADWTLHDEIYWGYRVGSDVTPILTTDHAKSGKPLAWIRQEKKSRVVYIQLGHGPQAFSDPNYTRLVAQSIAWAARK